MQLSGIMLSSTTLSRWLRAVGVLLGQGTEETGPLSAADYPVALAIQDIRHTDGWMDRNENASVV